MSILKELAKHDKKWRSYAFSITKDYEEANDLVQDMYIKMNRYQDAEWDNTYIYFTLRNLFISELRKKNVENNTISLDLVQYNLANDEEEIEQGEIEKAITERLKQHDEYYSELALIQADGMPYRKIAYLYHINYCTTFKKIAKIKKELKKDEYLKELYNSIK